MTLTLLQVALGGAAGAVARYLTGHAAVRLMGHGFPWGTVTVNVVGSFLMGILVVVLSEWSANRFAPLLLTGMLGGFTTFSTFSLETMRLFEEGSYWQAGSNVLLNVVICLAFAGFGIFLARQL